MKEEINTPGEKTSQAEIMQKHITTCQILGQTIASYCQEQGLAPSKLYYWQKRLKPVQPPQPTFVQLSPGMATSAVSIHFPNGVQLRFDNTIHISVLKELICCIY